MADSVTLTVDEARRQILRGVARDGLRVQGHLDLTNERTLTRLPEGLEVTRLTVRGCFGLTSLPTRLRCFELDAAESGIASLPDDLRVESRLVLSNCADLTRLPDGLRVGSLVLRGCTKLEALGEGLDVRFLDVSGCIQLSAWPQQASLHSGRLLARDCTRLTYLPEYLNTLAQLDVSGCTALTTLPEGLRVTSWLDIAQTEIMALPASLQGVRLRWCGVLVDERVVFHPETITGAEVLATSNIEVRRIKMERMGLERFFDEVNARERDRDRDPGGERRLLCVPLPGDEDLVCLAVTCPSTGRHYVLRVPPQMRRCHQAAAWIAGFDREEDYAPLAET